METSGNLILPVEYSVFLMFHVLYLSSYWCRQDAANFFAFSNCVLDHGPIDKRRLFGLKPFVGK